MTEDGLISWLKDKKMLKEAYKKLSDELIADGEKPISKERFISLVKELNLKDLSELDLNVIRQKIANEVNEYLKEDEYYATYSDLFYYDVKEFCKKCLKTLQLKLEEIKRKITDIIQGIVFENEKEGIELDFNSNTNASKIKLITIGDEKMIKKLKDNPPYAVSTRNNNLERRNNEVSGDNRYTEESRRIFEKLGRLATAIANHFGWEPGLVMQDFVKDLAIINDPSMLGRLDPNNPIDKMTQDLMSMYIGSAEDFNVFQNEALAQIMNMSEERAVQTLEKLIGRGQLGTTRANQFLGNSNQRRLGRGRDSEWNYEGWTVEDIIDEIEPEFEMIMNKESIKEPFKNLGELKSWIKGLYPLNSATKVEGFDTAVSRVLKHFNQRVMQEFGGYTDYPLTDSQSQEIAKYYRDFSDKYNLDLEDLIYGPEGFMETCYPNDFPDFKGDIIFSEKYWNEFEQWLKDTKGITLKHEDSSDFLVDSKEDEQRFAEKFGEKNLNRFKRLTQKLQGNYKDMTWVVAHIETTEDLNDVLNNADFGGYEPSDENEDWVVFKVEDLQKCQKLSNGTNWCITAPTAWNTYTGLGVDFTFYINKNTGDKYCVASKGGLNEIVDKNDREVTSLPEGVPGEEVRSSVVEEDMDIEEATLKTALANVQLMSVDELKIAWDDMFGEELDMLEDDEVKEWLTHKIPEIDSNELKTYLEEHYTDFIPSGESDNEELEEDDEDYFDDEDEEYLEDSKVQDNKSKKKSLKKDSATDMTKVKADIEKFRKLVFDTLKQDKVHKLKSVEILNIQFYGEDKIFCYNGETYQFDIKLTYDMSYEWVGSKNSLVRELVNGYDGLEIEVSWWDVRNLIDKLSDYDMGDINFLVLEHEFEIDDSDIMVNNYDGEAKGELGISYPVYMTYLEEHEIVEHKGEESLEDSKVQDDSELEEFDNQLKEHLSKFKNVKFEDTRFTEEGKNIEAYISVKIDFDKKKPIKIDPSEAIIDVEPDTSVEFDGDRKYVEHSYNFAIDKDYITRHIMYGLDLTDTNFNNFYLSDFSDDNHIEDIDTSDIVVLKEDGELKCSGSLSCLVVLYFEKEEE